MSLYNLLQGVNSQAEIALALIGNPDVGRFRDGWLELDSEGQPRVAIYTRNGGGNRECWADDPESCTDCTAHKMRALTEHPQYLSDADDSFDSTYATVYFSVPAEYVDEVRKIASPTPVDTDARWESVIRAIGGAK